MEKVIAAIVETVLAMMPKAVVKEWLDNQIDWIEDYVARSETKWDDITVLPVLKAARDRLDIPDLPDEEPVVE